MSGHRWLGPAAVLACSGAACVAIDLGDPTTPGGFLPPCPTKLIFGVDCPGCGAMRMIYSLMHGDVSKALHYNAFAAVAVLLLAYAFVAYTIGLWTGRRVRSWQHRRFAPMAVLVVTLGWFIVRNIPVGPFASLRV